MFNLSGRSTQADDDMGLKPKTFDDYSQAVQKGLPASDRKRMADAYQSLRYARGHFDDIEAERAGKSESTLARADTWGASGRNGEDGGRWTRGDFVLSQPVMRRVVDKLCENLYKRSPTRKLADPQVTEVLEQVYRKQGAGAKFQRADAYTAIGGASAFQFAGLDDRANPLKIHLWSADQLCVFERPGDPTEVDAVVTLDVRDGRTHATLWTEETVATYVTKRDQFPAGQERTYKLVSKASNPYRLPASADDQGRGIIPFSFFHWDYPATEFTWDSPGSNLRELNRYLNFGFDDLGDGIRYLSKPIGLAEGVDPTWEAPAVLRPGMFLNLAPGEIDAGGNGPAPRLSYLAPDNSFVQTIWGHLNNYLDLSLEMVGLPPSTIRMVLDARSGVSILAEQAPLLGWTEHRRRAFHRYEEQAATRALEVLASHLRAHGRDAKRFDEAAANPELQLLWPRLFVDLPGPERDRQDGVRIQWGHASIIDVLQERDDLTRDQALEKLKRVKRDADELAALGIDPIPAVLQAKPAAPSYAPFGQDPAAAAGDAQPAPEDGGDQDPGDLDAKAKIRSSGINGEPVDANGRADDLSQEGG